MSKKSSSDLFDLIKSLKQSEKRYFKIFSERHVIGEKNNYVMLFDAIDNMAEYDELALIKSNPFLKESLLSDQKYHLYGLILKSLAACVYKPFSIKISALCILEPIIKSIVLS